MRPIGIIPNTRAMSSMRSLLPVEQSPPVKAQGSTTPTVRERSVATSSSLLSSFQGQRSDGTMRPLQYERYTPSGALREHTDKTLGSGETQLTGLEDTSPVQKPSTSILQALEASGLVKAEIAESAVAYQDNKILCQSLLISANIQAQTGNKEVYIRA